MFQFGRFPSYTYFIQHMMHKVCLCGLLHSDICGSLYACYSPQLFAAYHVLRRLSMPRHSPYALCALPFELCASLFSIQNCYPTILIIKLVVFLICIYFSSLFNFQVPYCKPLKGLAPEKIHFIDFVAETMNFFHSTVQRSKLLNLSADDLFQTPFLMYES